MNHIKNYNSNNGCSSNNEGNQTKLSRKTSRKILERKNGIEYDDDEVILINKTPSIDEPNEQDFSINETDDKQFDQQIEENSSYRDENDSEPIENLNSVFDELFAAAKTGNTSATVALEVKLAEAALFAAEFERKSNSSTQSSSPVSGIISGKNESNKILNQQQNNSNNNLNAKSKYLGLIEVDGYSAQPLTRSCSCKRPGSFKKMRSKNNLNSQQQPHQQITGRTSSDHSKIDNEKQNSPENNYSTSEELGVINKPSNRAGSLPFETLDVNRNLDTYRLRCFNITSKGGIVNRGDSFKRSFKRSSRSVVEQNSPLTVVNDDSSCEVQSPQKQNTIPTPMLILSQASDDGSLMNRENDTGVINEIKTYPRNNNKLKLLKNSGAENTAIENIDTFVVYVVGSCGVGKNSLSKQFKTSEYHGTYDIDLNGSVEEIEESVSVMLDGIESRLMFMPIDIENSKQLNNNEELENYLSIQLINKNPIFEILKLTNDAYIVVYSVTDKSSFLTAFDLLKTIRSNEDYNYPIILVGNKSDLVRKRSITREEGQNLALKFNCKFVETSVAINDKVDDLLVGILKQIRLNIGIDADISGYKERIKYKNEDKMLHPIKEILKTAIFNETIMSDEQETSFSKNAKNKNNSSNKNQKKKGQLFKNFRFFPKRQNSDTENIYDIDSSDSNTHPNNNKNSKTNLSFFNKIFTHIFKRKSKRLLLRSVENLYTPVVVNRTLL